MYGAGNTNFVSYSARFRYKITIDCCPADFSFHRLVPIVRNYAGDVMIWDVNLVLKSDEVPKVSLGRKGQLGWTTWLSPRRSRTNAADLFLDASADSHASTVDHATKFQ